MVGTDDIHSRKNKAGNKKNTKGLYFLAISF